MRARGAGPRCVVPHGGVWCVASVGSEGCTATVRAVTERSTRMRAGDRMLPCGHREGRGWWRRPAGGMEVQCAPAPGLPFGQGTSAGRGAARSNGVVCAATTLRQPYNATLF